MKAPNWLRRALGRPVGNTDLAARNDSYDAQALAVMQRLLGSQSNCVDVGCHRGSVLDEILEIAPEGRHFAFEPLPKLCQKLRRRFARRANVEVFELALSDQAGRTTFQHVVSNPAYSGLRKRRYDSENERIETIEVATDRLDDVLPDGVPIHFVKIDVEGGELQVLRGAIEILRRHRPLVVFEHGLGAADYYGSGPEEVHDLLAGECGLRLHLMERWLRGEPALDRSEFTDRFHQGQDYYFMACE